MDRDPQPAKSQYLIDLPSRFDRLEPLIEIIATVLLALATLVCGLFNILTLPISQGKESLQAGLDVN